ncbi:MAG: response regulator [Cytophagales bacterium]|nr:response regulator [Cytophagales bacterium]
MKQLSFRSPCEPGGWYGRSRRAGSHPKGCCRFLRTLLCAWVLAAGTAYGQPVPMPLTAGHLNAAPEGLLLDSLGWRFQPGDQPAWAQPGFDDSGWPPVNSSFRVADPWPGWRDTGWFRLWVRVDTALVNQVLALQLDHYGASEIYLDGRRIGGFGKVGSSKAQTEPFVPFRFLTLLQLGDTRPHLIAIRYADFHQYFPNYIGFQSWLGTYEQQYGYINEWVRFNGYTLLGFAAMMALVLLHLFLFLFYPQQRANLYYSLAVFFMAVTVGASYELLMTTDPAWQQRVLSVMSMSKVLCTLMTAILMYSIGYTSLPRRRLVLVGLGATYLLLSYSVLPGLRVPQLFPVFFLVVVVDALRSITQAMRRGQPGVWLIGLGLLLVALVFFGVAVDVFDLVPPDAALNNLLMSTGVLFLPLCFSLYLAQDFARTNHNLTAQLRQVEALSARTLAQETERRRLITEQAERLEQTVRERTAQVQQQADRLREMDATKSRFFTNITHEFRTPLTLMLGPAEQVLARSQEPETKLQVGLLHRNAQRLLRLINQLLDLSKLEAGKMELDLAPGDLLELVRGTLQAFESLAAQQGVRLHLDAGAEPLPMALDRDKLEKILYNLFSNAVKFTGAGGTVRVWVARREEAALPWVELAVEDTGAGVPAAKLPYLFDRFYQADASDTRAQEGTGIGLALTKELVELHGGSIHLRSREGAGTTVTVRLPIHPAPAEAASSAHPPVHTPLLTGLPALPERPPQPADAPVVLVVEDNDDVRTFIRSTLQEHYQVLEAGSGAAGLRLAGEHVPDLIITDLMMPGMDGYQVCAALRQDERTSHIPVVMLTAKTDLDSRLEGLEAGADSYLGKPFSHRELIAQINNLLSVRRQLRERYSRENVWQPGSSDLPSLERAFLDRVRAAIEAHLDDEQYSVERLGEDVGLSRAQLHRKLKALTNQTPGDLVRIIRLEQALALLKANVGTVAEVAYRVGFGNPANFSTSFSRHFGYPPSQVHKKADPSA